MGQSHEAVQSISGAEKISLDFKDRKGLSTSQNAMDDYDLGVSNTKCIYGLVRLERCLVLMVNPQVRNCVQRTQFEVRQKSDINDK